MSDRYTIEPHVSGNYQVVLTLDYLRHVIAINQTRDEAETTAARLNSKPPAVCDHCQLAGILEPLPCSGGAAGPPVYLCVWCTTQIHWPNCEGGCNV